MKIFVFAVLTLSLCTFLSCKKNSEEPKEPETDNRPLQLVKKILRTESNGKIYADSTAFIYDAAGHLTTLIDLETNFPIRRLVYNGDSLVALNNYINGVPDTIRNPVQYLDGGNTISIVFTRPNSRGKIDTIQNYYKWLGNQMLEAWSYFQVFNKSVFSYDASGNQFEHFIFDAMGANFQSRVLAYDQKKNYYNAIPRINFLFTRVGLLYDGTRSVNNPTKIELGGPGKIMEYNWTYNNDGYPLTMQVKGQNFIALELTYNK